MSVSDPAGLAGTIVPLAQQTQPPATPMQLTDIIPQAAPQHTQPAMIPQQTIVQQQQIGMDPQTSTQQQMEAQATLLEQQLSTTQPPTEQPPQSLSAAAVQTHQHEPQQQICVQQPVPPVLTTSQQQALPTQTGTEQRAMSLPQQVEQPQTLKPQPTGDPCEQTLLQPQQLQQQQTLLHQQQQQALLLEHRQAYVKQQFDQHQQQALLQQQQQQQQLQLEQQQALIHKQLLDQQQQQTLAQQQEQQQQQQQQGLLQQQQPQQALLQHQLEQQQPQPPLQQQSQLYQQIVQQQAGIQKEPEKQQQQQAVLQPPQQTQQQKEQQLQQQALLRQIEHQQQQALIQQHLQQQAILQQHQLQQTVQLQQQQQEQQQVQLKQQIEQQQQALMQQQLEQQRQQQILLQQQQAERLQQQALLQQQLQEQKQAAIIQLQQTEKQEAVSIPQSHSDQQIQQQPTDIQHACIPQLNTAQFPPHATFTQQQVMEQQQHAALIQQQQAFAAQPQHQASVIDPHMPVGAPAGTEVIQHQTQIVSQAQVPMAIQTTQIPVQTSAVVPTQVLTQQGQSEAHPQNQGQVPVQFIAQSTAPAVQAVMEAQVTPPAAMIQGQTHIIQTQQIPLQTSYPGPVPPTQSQITTQPLIQTQPLQMAISQTQPPGLGQTVDIQMMGQQNQAAVQVPAAITSIPNQVQHETGLLQAQLQQQTQGQPPIQVHAQAAAGLLTSQYAPQTTHPAMPPVQQDKTHITLQQQQEPLLQYPQMILSPGSAGSVGTTTDSLNSTADPANFVATPHPVQQAGQAYMSSQTTLHPVAQAQQQPLGSTADPSVIQPICQPAMPQSTGQYQQQLQKLSQAQQPLAPPPPQAQFLAQPIPTPIQQPLPPKQALIPIDESQLSTPSASHLVTHPAAQGIPLNVAGPQSQNRTVPLYSQLVAGAPLSPQHQSKQMLPAHTHTQTSIQAQTHSQTQTHVQTQAHSHTQTHTETHIAEQPVLPQAVFPAQQTPPSPSRTSCPPSSLPSLPTLPSYLPAVAPMPELPTSPPAAQVTLPGQANSIPTSPPPVTTLQSLDSNAPKLPQASLQDCDLSLLGIAQVQEE